MRERFAIVLIFFLSCTAKSPGPEPIRIFAAASLTTVLPEIAREFEKNNPETGIEFNFAGSSLLAKQIVQGAKADLYLSANPEWVEYLETRNLLLSEKYLFGNKLVLVTPAGNPKGIQDLSDLTRQDISKIALADWTHVPSGIYAKKALAAAGLWQQIKYRCLPALDVRAALTYVERGEVDCGIVYQTDTSIASTVAIARTIPDSLTPDIRYEAALLRASSHPEAKQLYLFLSDSTAQSILIGHGFVL